MEKLLKLFIPYMILLSGIISSVSAAGSTNGQQIDFLDQICLQNTPYKTTIITPMATFSYDFEVKPSSVIGITNLLLPLEENETVTINASYSPLSASVDFGLIAPDGYFYYSNVKNGSINKTIRVDERGNYMLAVRNNSSSTISVVGFVNY